MDKQSPDKTRVPQQQRSVQTRTRILEAAVQLFAEKGYYYTNTKEIAKAAGVATGSFYSYFADKREVLVAALAIRQQEFMETIESRISSITKQETGKREQLLQIIHAMLDAHHLFDFLNSFMETLSAADQEIFQLSSDIHDKGIALTWNHMMKLSEELTVRDKEAAAALVYFSMRRIIDVIAHKQSELDGERLINELADMLTVYLFGPK